MPENQNQTEFSFENLMDLENFSLEEETVTDTAEETEVTEETLQNTSEEETEAPAEESQEEEEQEEKEKPAEEEKPKLTEETDTASPYTTIVQDLLESGDWEDVIIETEEGEVKLSEMKNVDRDTYLSVKKDVETRQKEDLESNYVLVKDLDENRRRLLNIVKDGDWDKVKEVFQNPQALQRPFEGYDNNNDAHNEQVLSWYYQSIGNSPEETKDLIQVAKKNLSLDAKAVKVVEAQQKQFDNMLKQKEAQIQAEKAAEQEKLKDYRKNLTDYYKGTGLSETKIRRLVDSATKYNKDGELEIDTIYESVMEDPKKAADYILYLQDPEAFLKLKTAEVKKQTQMDAVRKVKRIQDTSKTAKKTEQKKEEKPDSSNPFANIVLED